MKSLWKYITGFFAFVIGILVLSGKKNKKVKEIKGKIKDVESRVKEVDTEIKNAKNKGNAYKKSLESKKKALKEIEAQKYKHKDIGVKEASDFLKKYKKK